MFFEENDPILTTLHKGKLSLRGEFMWGSNYTYLVQVDLDQSRLSAVYKPTRGVRPLWDFPSTTLARREVAAYIVSQALGWNLVPPTVYRDDGPLGPGSLQLYIEHDPEYHYFNFTPQDRQRLRPTALFDLLVNNADRKGSHILVDEQKHIWLIDHGICFHVEDKLRTVIWDFAGEAFPDELVEDLRRFRDELCLPPSTGEESNELVKALKHYLSHAEIVALIHRAERLLTSGRFPEPHPGRRQYPWPPV